MKRPNQFFVKQFERPFLFQFCINIADYAKLVPECAVRLLPGFDPNSQQKAPAFLPAGIIGAIAKPSLKTTSILVYKCQSAVQ